MAYTVVMMVQFHDTFVTKFDRAYQIRCFYGENDATVTSSLHVSPLTTLETMQEDYPAPNCKYEIHLGTPTGPLATFVRVGDPVYHVFKCDYSKRKIF